MKDSAQLCCALVWLEDSFPQLEREATQQQPGGVDQSDQRGGVRQQASCSAAGGGEPGAACKLDRRNHSSEP